MSRERRRLPGVELATSEPAGLAAHTTSPWPGKQSSTLDLEGPRRPVAELAGSSPDREAPRPDLDALDRTIGELLARPRASDDPARWVAQQQRATRWQTVLAWAAAHRTR